MGKSVWRKLRNIKGLKTLSCTDKNSVDTGDRQRSAFVHCSAGGTVHVLWSLGCLSVYMHIFRNTHHALSIYRRSF